MFIVSPSQMKVYLTCPRKWYAQYILKLPNPKGPAFTYGIEFHEGAESYMLGDGIPETLDRQKATMLRDGAVHLPLAGTVPVESLYAGILAPGIMYQCRLDFEFYTEVENDGIGDHKTTSGPQYAMDAETLREDVQCVMGAYARYDRGAKGVDAKWVYYNKKKKHDVWPVRVAMPRDHVLNYMNTKVIPAAKEMLALRQASLQGINAVTNDPEGCDGVGTWCNFKPYCDMWGDGQVKVKL